MKILFESEKERDLIEKRIQAALIEVAGEKEKDLGVAKEILTIISKCPKEVLKS